MEVPLRLASKELCLRVSTRARRGPPSAPHPGPAGDPPAASCGAPGESCKFPGRSCKILCPARGGGAEGAAGAEGAGRAPKDATFVSENRGIAGHWTELSSDTPSVFGGGLGPLGAAA